MIEKELWLSHALLLTPDQHSALIHRVFDVRLLSRIPCPNIVPCSQVNRLTISIPIGDLLYGVIKLQLLKSFANFREQENQNNLRKAVKQRL